MDSLAHSLHSLAHQLPSLAEQATFERLRRHLAVLSGLYGEDQVRVSIHSVLYATSQALHIFTQQLTGLASSTTLTTLPLHMAVLVHRYVPTQLPFSAQSLLHATSQVAPLSALKDFWNRVVLAVLASLRWMKALPGSILSSISQIVRGLLKSIELHIARLVSAIWSVLRIVLLSVAGVIAASLLIWLLVRTLPIILPCLQNSAVSLRDRFFTSAKSKKIYEQNEQIRQQEADIWRQQDELRYHREEIRKLKAQLEEERHRSHRSEPKPEPQQKSKMLKTVAEKRRQTAVWLEQLQQLKHVKVVSFPQPPPGKCHLSCHTAQRTPRHLSACLHDIEDLFHGWNSQTISSQLRLLCHPDKFYGRVDDNDDQGKAIIDQVTEASAILNDLCAKSERSTK